MSHAGPSPLNTSGGGSSRARSRSRTRPPSLGFSPRSNSKVKTTFGTSERTFHAKMPASLDAKFHEEILPPHAAAPPPNTGAVVAAPRVMQYPTRSGDSKIPTPKIHALDAEKEKEKEKKAARGRVRPSSRAPSVGRAGVGSPRNTTSQARAPSQDRRAAGTKRTTSKEPRSDTREKRADDDKEEQERAARQQEQREREEQERIAAAAEKLYQERLERERLEREQAEAEEAARILREQQAQAAEEARQEAERRRLEHERALLEAARKGPSDPDERAIWLEECKLAHAMLKLKLRKLNEEIKKTQQEIDRGGKDAGDFELMLEDMFDERRELEQQIADFNLPDEPTPSHQPTSNAPPAVPINAEDEFFNMSQSGASNAVEQINELSSSTPLLLPVTLPNTANTGAPLFLSATPSDMEASEQQRSVQSHRAQEAKQISQLLSTRNGIGEEGKPEWEAQPSSFTTPAKADTASSSSPDAISPSTQASLQASSPSQTATSSSLSSPSTPASFNARIKRGSEEWARERMERSRAEEREREKERLEKIKQAQQEAEQVKRDRDAALVLERERAAEAERVKANPAAASTSSSSSNASTAADSTTAQRDTAAPEQAADTTEEKQSSDVKQVNAESDKSEQSSSPPASTHSDSRHQLLQQALTTPIEVWKVPRSRWSKIKQVKLFLEREDYYKKTNDESLAGYFVRWSSSKTASTTSIYLRSSTTVHLDQTHGLFATKARDVNKKLAGADGRSMTIEGTNRTLDIVMSNQEDYENWQRVLQYIIEANAPKQSTTAPSE